MRNCHYHVAPRYSAGSPSLVSEFIALRVAEQEKRGHEQALSGAWGDREKLRAERLGLRGVAELREETKKGWLIFDLCTEEFLLKLYDPEKVGYRQFHELDTGTQRALRMDPPPGVEEVEREFYKVDPALMGHVTKDVTIYRPEVLSEERVLEMFPKAARLMKKETERRRTERAGQ